MRTQFVVASLARQYDVASSVTPPGNVQPVSRPTIPYKTRRVLLYAHRRFQKGTLFSFLTTFVPFRRHGETKKKEEKIVIKHPKTSSCRGGVGGTRMQCLCFFFIFTLFTITAAIIIINIIIIIIISFIIVFQREGSRTLECGPPPPPPRRHEGPGPK